MTGELESRLRTALGHAAGRAPKAPPFFPTEVVSRSNRRRRRRNALVAGICVTVIAVPIGLAATRGLGNGDVITGTPSTAAPKNYVFGDEFRVGAALVIDNPAESRPMSLWYARTDHGLEFCSRVKDRSGGGRTECAGLVAREATEQGSTESSVAPSSGLVLYYGTAGDKVARITAVTGAGKVSGTVHHPKGAPLGIWTVTVPWDKAVTAFEFTGPAGETITRIERPPAVSPEADATPVGPTVEMPGKLVVGLYEIPDKILIWKLNGQAVGEMDWLSRRGAVIQRLGQYKEHWFGITSTETARVDLIFQDGTTVEAGTRAEPWRVGGFRLFAGIQRHSQDVYRDGFRIAGYDKNGVELWHEDHERS